MVECGPWLCVGGAGGRRSPCRGEWEGGDEASWLVEGGVPPPTQPCMDLLPSTSPSLSPTPPLPLSPAWTCSSPPGPPSHQPHPSHSALHVSTSSSFPLTNPTPPTQPCMSPPAPPSLSPTPPLPMDSPHSQAGPTHLPSPTHPLKGSQPKFGQ